MRFTLLLEMLKHLKNCCLAIDMDVALKKKMATHNINKLFATSQFTP